MEVQITCPSCSPPNGDFNGLRHTTAEITYYASSSSTARQPHSCPATRRPSVPVLQPPNMWRHPGVKLAPGSLASAARWLTPPATLALDDDGADHQGRHHPPRPRWGTRAEAWSGRACRRLRRSPSSPACRPICALACGPGVRRSFSFPPSSALGGGSTRTIASAPRSRHPRARRARLRGSYGGRGSVQFAA